MYLVVKHVTVLAMEPKLYLDSTVVTMQLTHCIEQPVHLLKYSNDDIATNLPMRSLVSIKEAVYMCFTKTTNISDRFFLVFINILSTNTGFIGQQQCWNRSQSTIFKVSPSPMVVFAKLSPQDLSFPDELGQLLDLCFGGHVHILVSDADDHAPQDGRIRL